MSESAFAPSPPLAPSARRRLLRRHLLAYAALALGAAAMIIPFLWMLSTSLKNDMQAYQFPPIWIPRPAAWENYPNAWNALPFNRFFLNSAFVSLVLTGGQLLTCSLGAFAFARLRFPGREQLFVLYLATLMIPFQVVMIPLFVLVSRLRWIDSFWGLTVPLAFSPYGTFLLRQFFKSIPRELEDASKIDGCSYWRIYWNVMLPLSKPALATLGIFVFMWSWNNFLWPLLIINSLEMKTLPLGLAYFLGQYTVYWNLLMVGATIALAPVLIVFFFAQRYFIEGITLTGLKG